MAGRCRPPRPRASCIKPGPGEERMKLLRYGEIGQEKPGILDASGLIRDLSGVIDDFAGATLGRESLSRIKALDLAALPVVAGAPRIGAPVGVVPKFLGIGLNYRDHAEETGHADSRGPDRVRQGELLRLRSHRSGAPAQGLRSHGFRGRARSRDRHARKERSRGRVPSTTSRVTRSATTSPSGACRRAVRANGSKPRAAILSGRSALGSSPPTRSKTRKISTLPSISTAPACRPDRPRP